MRLRELLIGVFLLLAPASAQSHPHEWVDVASEVLFDAKGRIAAIRHHWRFDEAFTAFALQGLDTDRDGLYSPQELEPLALVNVESLAEFDFFTFVSAGDYTAGFAKPTDYRLDLDDNRLTLHYTLPLAQPLFTKSQVLVQVYDPEYYIAFSLPSREAVRLVDAPAGCRLAVYPAEAPDAAAAAALATIGPDQRELPAEMQGLATGIDNSAEINCGGPVVATTGAETDSGAASNAGEALAEMADSNGGHADLSALPGEGAASAQSANPAPPPAASASGGFMARIAALQTRFNRDLTEALKALKETGSAFWWLGGISFAYGIVHAAGPGHGKVVISSYLLANEERLRRGVAIAFLSALVQAFVAIGIVGLMAVILNMTSMAMTVTAKLLEAGSFALVAALGLYLLARKSRQAAAVLRGGDAHAHHHHGDHDHGAGHGRIQWEEPAAQPSGHRHHAGAARVCHHHAAPAELKPGASGAAAAILSVGIRPCSGALVVLVFALTQGIFWAGIASTFLMALGTAMTVAALAALAVGAKDVARRLAGGEGRRSGQIMLGLEIVAALLVTALGVVLFAGSLRA